MRWQCARGCGEQGEKRYPSAAQASRYARAFDREDHEQLGRRSRLFAFFPLRILQAARRGGGR